MGRWFRDARGESLVSYVVILPIFVLLIFGALELGKLISVRESLDLGVDHAARYLAVALRDGVFSEPEREETLNQIRSTLFQQGLNNPNVWASQATLHDLQVVYLTAQRACPTPAEPGPSPLFRVTVLLDLPLGLPFFGTITLQGKQTAPLDCPPVTWPADSTTWPLPVDSRRY